MRDIDPKKIPVLDDIIEPDMDELENSARSENLIARPAGDFDIADLEQENNLDLFSIEQLSVDLDKLDDSLTEADVGNFGAQKEADQSEELTNLDTTEISHQFEYSQSLNTFSEVTEHDLHLAIDDNDEEDTDDNLYSEDTDDLSLDDAQAAIESSMEAVINADNEEYDEIKDEFDEADDNFESALISFVDDDEIVLPKSESSSEPDIDFDIASEQEDSLQPQNTDLIDNRIDIMVDNIVQQLLPDLEQQLRSLLKQTLQDNMADALKKSLPTDN